MREVCVLLFNSVLFPGCVKGDATAKCKRECADVWMPCSWLQAREGRSAAAKRHGGDEPCF